MKQVQMTLTEKTPLTADVWQLRFAGDTSPITHPGQFVNLELPGRFLRRPISVCDWDEETLTLLVRVAGKGTAELCQAQPGTVFDLLSGLGNGFDLDECTGTPILIGGGIGVPPMLELMKELSCERTAVLGYRDQQLFLKDEFEACGPVCVATEDGSAGTKGNVLDAIREQGVQGEIIYACGPTPMLRAVKAYAMEKGIECYISLEERMACGIGACLACVCQSKDVDSHSHVHNKRICKDGPVFAAEEVEV